MRMPELTDKLENREFEQVWGVGMDSYEDFYITDKKMGILLCVSREAGDYIIVEIDRDWQIRIETWEDILSS